MSTDAIQQRLILLRLLQELRQQDEPQRGLSDPKNIPLDLLASLNTNLLTKTENSSNNNSTLFNGLGPSTDQSPSSLYGLQDHMRLGDLQNLMDNNASYENSRLPPSGNCYSPNQGNLDGENELLMHLLLQQQLNARKPSLPPPVNNAPIQADNTNAGFSPELILEALVSATKVAGSAGSDLVLQLVNLLISSTNNTNNPNYSIPPPPQQNNASPSSSQIAALEAAIDAITNQQNAYQYHGNEALGYNNGKLWNENSPEANLALHRTILRQSRMESNTMTKTQGRNSRNPAGKKLKNTTPRNSKVKGENASSNRKRGVSRQNESHLNSPKTELQNSFEKSYNCGKGNMKYDPNDMYHALSTMDGSLSNSNGRSSYRENHYHGDNLSWSDEKSYHISSSKGNNQPPIQQDFQRISIAEFLEKHYDCESLPEHSSSALAFGSSSESETDERNGRKRRKERRVNMSAADALWHPHFHPHNQEFRVRYRYKGSMRLKTLSCSRFGREGAKRLTAAFVARWQATGRHIADRTIRSKLALIDLPEDAEQLPFYGKKRGNSANGSISGMKGSNNRSGGSDTSETVSRDDFDKFETKKSRDPTSLSVQILQRLAMTNDSNHISESHSELWSKDQSAPRHNSMLDSRSMFHSNNRMGNTTMLPSSIMATPMEATTTTTTGTPGSFSHSLRSTSPANSSRESLERLVQSSGMQSLSRFSNENVSRLIELGLDSCSRETPTNSSSLSKEDEALLSAKRQKVEYDEPSSTIQIPDTASKSGKSTNIPMLDATALQVSRYIDGTSDEIMQCPEKNNSSLNYYYCGNIPPTVTPTTSSSVINQRNNEIFNSSLNVQSDILFHSSDVLKNINEDILKEMKNNTFMEEEGEVENRIQEVDACENKAEESINDYYYGQDSAETMVTNKDNNHETVMAQAMVDETIQNATNNNDENESTASIGNGSIQQDGNVDEETHEELSVESSDILPNPVISMEQVKALQDIIQGSDKELACNFLQFMNSSPQNRDQLLALCTNNISNLTPSMLNALVNSSNEGGMPDFNEMLQNLSSKGGEHTKIGESFIMPVSGSESRERSSADWLGPLLACEDNTNEANLNTASGGATVPAEAKSDFVSFGR